MTERDASAHTHAANTPGDSMSRVRRRLRVAMAAFVVVLVAYIAPDLLAALRNVPEADPGKRTTRLLMLGGSILGVTGLIVLPTLPLMSQQTRLRSWIGCALILAGVMLDVLYLTR